VFIVNSKVNWANLSGNQNAIHLLEQHLDKVDWFWLSGNPNAIHILEKNLDKVDWFELSRNPNAIHLLSKLDTNKMRENNKVFAEELVAHVLNPLRLNRICETYGVELDELVELCW
jgi:hypothetical protein